MKPATPFAIGAAVFSVAQIAWSLGHAFGGLRSAWAMKTGSGIGLCFGALLVAAAVVSARHREPIGLAKCAGPVALGAIAAMAIALIFVGPGSLWPLVLVLDGTIVGVGALVGAAIGIPFRSRNAD